MSLLAGATAAGGAVVVVAWAAMSPAFRSWLMALVWWLLSGWVDRGLAGAKARLFGPAGLTGHVVEIGPGYGASIKVRAFRRWLRLACALTAPTLTRPSPPPPSLSCSTTTSPAASRRRGTTPTPRGMAWRLRRRQPLWQRARRA
jgi:hypothetical protein